MTNPTGALFGNPQVKPLSSDGTLMPSCTATFYRTGTTILENVYVDGLLTTALTNPITADVSGTFPAIYLDPAVIYRVQIKTSLGVLISDTDPVIPGVSLNSLTSGVLGRAMHPRTAAEIALGITPTNFAYPAYTVLRYGADPTGVANSTTAVQNCINVAAEAGHCRVTVGLPGAAIKLSGNLTWPVDKVGIDWQGAFLDCTGQTAGFVFAPTASYVDDTTRVGLLKSHPMENFFAVGPVTSANHDAFTTTGFMSINDANARPLAGITVRNGGTANFYTHLSMGQGAFFCSFENWAFESVPIGGSNGFSNTYIDIPYATNSGERNSFMNCFFGIAASNRHCVMLNQANNNADTYFKNCSFDCIGTAGRLFTISAGGVYLDACHLEGSGDTDNWFFVSGLSTVLAWNQLCIVLDGVKTSFALFSCDSSVTAGGISVGDTTWVSNSNYPLPLISGQGRVQVKGMLSTYGGGVAPQYISTAINLVADPPFRDNTFARDAWMTSGGAPPTLVGTPVPRNASNVIKFTCASGQKNSATLTRRCNPGQIASAQVFVETTSFTGSGATLNVALNYLDANGDVLKSVLLAAITTTIAVYSICPTHAGGGTFVSAPAGTVNVQFSLNVMGYAVTGSPMAFVGMPVLNVT